MTLTKAQHTPGPWRAVPHNPTEPLSHPYVEAEHRSICQVYRGGYGETTPEGEANARLIAKAPELLAIVARLMEQAQANADQHTDVTGSDEATERDLVLFDAWYSTLTEMFDTRALLAEIDGGTLNVTQT